MSNKNKSCPGFIIIKPDAVANNMVGTILQIFEQNDFQIGWLQKIQLSASTVRMLYKEHVTKGFFNEHLKFMTEGAVVVVRLFHDHDPTELIRRLCGATDPMEADTESIRSRFGSQLPRNAIHFSDSMVFANIESEFIYSKHT